jgi:outer membrane lipoprotein-sorting protein
VNILRRLPLPRLLLLCGLVVLIGVSATALAFALGAGPTPPPKPLADAVHDALAGGRGESIEGLSASVTLTDHLLEGASLATGGHGGELASSPLVTGAAGRLWIAKDGDVRLELQSQQGDTQILYDGHTVTVYDAATNTLYRYTPPTGEDGSSSSSGTPPSGQHEAPSVAKIEEAIARLSRHANVSGATPTDVAGQPAYTVRVSPDEGGSLFGGVELSWDANNGIPLRAAIYSSTSSSPVIELAATEVSFGAVESSVFDIDPPANAKVEEVASPSSHALHGAHRSAEDSDGPKPKLTTSGHGPSAVAILEAKEKTGSGSKKGASEALEGLPKVTIDGTSASELRTELGTLLAFERSGVRYLLAGSVTPATIEAVARGL